VALLSPRTNARDEITASPGCVTDCLEEGRVRHVPIVGAELNELDDGCWCHAFFLGGGGAEGNDLERSYCNSLPVRVTVCNTDVNYMVTS
jgi:hypothetical protein